MIPVHIRSFHLYDVCLSSLYSIPDSMWPSDFVKSCKVKNSDMTVVFRYFLSTHKSYHHQTYTIVTRYPDEHVDIFKLIRNAFFIKWANSQIDAPELFWPSIFITITTINQSSIVYLPKPWRVTKMNGSVYLHLKI